MDYEKRYKEALKRARELVAQWTGKNKDFYIEDYSYIFPELRKEEKPLTPFQQCLSHILYKVYYASAPGKVDKFILDIIKNRTDELVELAKRHQPSWKPTEEQMNALQRAVNKLAKTDVADSVRLSIMYDNLKKL